MRAAEGVDLLVVLLRDDPQNTFPGRELAEQLGINTNGNYPELRHLVNEARAMGFPVVSNSHGYKWAQSKAEIIGTLDHMYSRMEAMHRAAGGLLRSLGDFDE